MAHADALTPRQNDIRRAGDALQLVLPLSALALTYVVAPGAQGPPVQDFTWHDLISMNGSPRHDLLLAMGRTFVVTEALKLTVNETRPNGGPESFPSGHSSIAFAGAEFIRKEYGWRFGAPAYAAAAFVAWSRVEAHEHHTHDVLAGALIGIASNHDFSELRTRFGRVSLLPGMIDPEGGAEGHPRRAPVLTLNLNLEY